MRARAPVVLVPGAFGQDLVYWNVIRYLLQRDGYPVHTVTFPRLTLADLRASAELLRRKVDRVLDREAAERVSLVGHSMGGLIIRHYVKFLGGHDLVDRVVYMGVPHRGAWIGATFPLLRGMRQILPGSPFLNALNAPGGADERIPTTNIYSPTDFIVLPPSTSVLPESPLVANRVAPLAGHWGMLVSPRVYGWIAEALDAPEGGALAHAGREGPLLAAAEEYVEAHRPRGRRSAEA